MHRKSKNYRNYRTWIERKMAEFLSESGIRFKEQKRIKRCRCVPDFYLPETNTVLFTDGTFWHSKPRRQFCDQRINKRLVKAGYHVIRVWEHDMKNNFKKVATDLLLNLDAIRNTKKNNEGSSDNRNSQQS